MKIGRLVAAIVAISLLALLAVGCEKVDLPEVSDPPVSDQTESAPPETPGNSEPPIIEEPADYFDYEKAAAAFAPDTVMFTAGGVDVTWDEFYYFLGNNVYSASQSLDLSTGWDMPYSGDVPIGAYIIEQAMLGALESCTIASMAESLKVSLTEAEEDEITLGIESMIVEYGSEELLNKTLADNFFNGGIEQYKNYMRNRYLLLSCFEGMYGENGSLMSDAELAEYTKDDGYLMAKHILATTAERDATGVLVPLSPEEIAAADKKIKDVLDKLDSFEGGDLDAYFTELMRENSEDPGLVSYPDGYLFQDGDMMPEFYEGAVALEIGDYSRIIETDYGYHIIYRLPINYEVPPSNMQYSLRLLCAEEIFFLALQEWQLDMDVEYSATYSSLDLAAIFLPNN